MLQCPRCEKKLGSKVQLRKHLKIVHGEADPYLCNVCGFTTKHQGSLKEHQIMHDGKGYCSDICICLGRYKEIFWQD